ncbi:MAG: aminotransferase class I/II-fold pyridoxal phosphate-dependent enzyme [Gemmatimonadetes bacterium]|nr:aminotransferase class I/II-fold pyridoxal phosphate-dependent enzyme [Gemmatimonadota bacterium]
MTRFPRPDFSRLGRYETGREPSRTELGDNTNLWGPHPLALKRIREAGERDLAGYPDTYAETLARAVSDKYGFGPECVTSGHGSDGVLDYSMRCSGAPGAAVRYPAPTFSMVAPMAVMNGLKPSPVAWPKALEDASILFRGDPAVVYVCRPNNPTGELAPRGWLEQVLESADERFRDDPGTAPLLLVDEAYAEFSGDTVIEQAPSHPRLVVLRTLSKAYGLAGLRCGYGVAGPEVALEIDKARGPFAVSRLAVEAAALAVREGDEWIAQVVAECVANRDRLAGELAGRGLDPWPSHTNFVLFRVPEGGTAKALFDGFLANDVWVRPFPRVPGLPESLRVTVGPWPAMRRFLEVLDLLLASGAAGATTGLEGAEARRAIV